MVSRGAAPLRLRWEGPRDGVARALRTHAPTHPPTQRSSHLLRTPPPPPPMPALPLGQVRAVIPRRTNLPIDRGVLIVCAATHKQRNTFFALVQSEYGDLYKVCGGGGEDRGWMRVGGCMGWGGVGWVARWVVRKLGVEAHTHSPGRAHTRSRPPLPSINPPPPPPRQVTLAYEGQTVTELVCKYFDTIPTANAIAVMRKGLLFAGSEFGDHTLYQFTVRGGWMCVVVGG